MARLASLGSGRVSGKLQGRSGLVETDGWACQDLAGVRYREHTRQDGVRCEDDGDIVVVVARQRLIEECRQDWGVGGKR